MEAPVRVCVVIGAGDATGSAVARRFARGGLVVVPVRRNAEKLQHLVEAIEAEGGRAVAMACDARREADVAELFEAIEQDVGPIHVLVHNIGANVRFLVTETSERKYRKVWEMAALSAFLSAREASKRMSPRNSGTLIFTGATASIRGSRGYSAFAGAMHAKRALAQSLAQEEGPNGLHVVHVVIDGPIDTAFVRQLMGEELYQRKKVGGSLLHPEDIAEAYWQLHCQPRSAWTHEMDLRPYEEPIASRL